MGLFKSFDRLKLEQVDENKPVNTPLFLSSENRFALLINNIRNINNNNTDDEIKYFIYQEHINILNYDLFLLHKDSRQVCQELFKNIRFLKLFLSVINYLNLNRHEIICLNKLAYDYYLIDDINKDEEVRDLLLTISYEINKKQVIQLSAILGINKARLLALIGNSSFKEDRRVRKICSYIVKLANYEDIEITLQNIVDILLIFIDLHYTNTYIAIMLESPLNNYNVSERTYFDMITKASIEILISMTSNDIYKVLNEYGNYLKLYNINNTRIKMNDIKAIYSDNNRLISIINEIEITDNIIKNLW